MSTFPPTAGFINSLDPASPINADFVYGSDDWHRFIQQVLVNQFPNGNGGDGIGLDAAVNPTPDEFNTLEGINTGSTIESRLAALEAAVDPIGRITPWPISEAGYAQTLTGSLAPGGGTWHVCDGTNLDGSSTYASLYAIIGNQFGGTDAASMEIPKLNGRVIAGRGDGNVLTGYRQGLNDDTIGNTGGIDKHLQASDEMYEHIHGKGTLRVAGTTRSAAGGVGAVTESLRDPPSGDLYELDGDMASEGGTAEMSITQPTIIIAWYIRVL